MEIVDLLSKKGGWEDDYSATADQVDGAFLACLDTCCAVSPATTR